MGLSDLDNLDDEPAAIGNYRRFDDIQNGSSTADRFKILKTDFEHGYEVILEDPKFGEVFQVLAMEENGNPEVLTFRVPKENQKKTKYFGFFKQIYPKVKSISSTLVIQLSRPPKRTEIGQIALRTTKFLEYLFLSQETLSIAIYQANTLGNNLFMEFVVLYDESADLMPKNVNNMPQIADFKISDVG